MSWLPWAVWTFVALCAVSLAVQWWQGRQLRLVTCQQTEHLGAGLSVLIDAVNEQPRDVLAVLRDVETTLDAILLDGQDGRTEREERLRNLHVTLHAIRADTGALRDRADPLGVAPRYAGDRSSTGG